MKQEKIIKALELIKKALRNIVENQEKMKLFRERLIMKSLIETFVFIILNMPKA